MASANVKIPIGDIAKQSVIVMHVKTTGRQWLIFRMRCAIPFLWLAAKVAGVKGCEFRQEHP